MRYGCDKITFCSVVRMKRKKIILHERSKRYEEKFYGGHGGSGGGEVKKPHQRPRRAEQNEAHGAHGEVEQRHEKDQRPQELPLFGLRLLEGEVFRRFAPGGLLPGGIRRSGAVAGLLHQPGDIRRLQGGFIVVHHHVVGQQVHIHRADPLGFGKALFDVSRAG